VLVIDRCCTVADDDIAIRSVADRCLLSGVIQTSHFKGVTTVFVKYRKSRLLMNGAVMSQNIGVAKGILQQPLRGAARLSSEVFSIRSLVYLARDRRPRCDDRRDQE
jgi:hypothetical protein